MRRHHAVNPRVDSYQPEKDRLLRPEQPIYCFVGVAPKTSDHGAPNGYQHRFKTGGTRHRLSGALYC
jgi:hypothetical protein